MKNLGYLFAVFLFLIPASSVFGGGEKTLAEIWLAPEHKDDTDRIKNTLRNHNITRVTIQLYKVGVPGAIVAIGENTPAESARIAIELAKIYNRKKVEFLIPEALVPENYFAVGTSAYDEVVLVPVGSADVDRLLDPSLSTEAFHALYRKLTHADEPFKRNYKRGFNEER
ncbi:MAG: hypothetical protein ACYDBV_04370 [Nitrospiria bacterium]